MYLCKNCLHKQETGDRFCEVCGDNVTKIENKVEPVVAKTLEVKPVQPVIKTTKKKVKKTKKSRKK